MDFNALVEKLTWKKIVVVTLVALFGIWILREVMFWTFFHEARQLFGQFNTQFEQQQKQIHNKLAESESDFDKRTKDFDEGFKKTDQMFEQTQKRFQETMDALDKEALERDKKFDEAFAKAPQQMFDQHQAMGEKMFNEFKQESRRQSDDFIKNIMNVDKTSEETRCSIALGNRPNNRTAPPELTPQQLKERANNLMRIRKEIAKVEHCEKYV